MSDNNHQFKIQDTVPVRTIGIETERENLDFQHRPPHRYAHVWFAPRPTPVSRLAVLASVLPDSIDDDTLLNWMGFKPSNRNPEDSIAEHVRNKRQTKDQRSGSEHEHYGYRKIWRYTPSDAEKDEIHNSLESTWDGELPTILDATAGGGSIPLESIRYGLPTIANELNPVPSVVLKALLEYTRTDVDLTDDIIKWGDEIDSRAREELQEFFPERDDEKIQTYLFAHRVTCPDCGLKVPLASNWWLDRNRGSGKAVRPRVNDENDHVDFDIVDIPEDVERDEFNPTDGTVSYSKMTCPRCHVTLGSDSLKEKLQEGDFDYQLYAIYYDTYTSGGCEFRKPDEEDFEAFEKATEFADSDVEISTSLTESIPSGEKTTELRRNGMSEWRDLFTPRQLLTHHTYWQKFEEVKEEIQDQYPEQQAESILIYLCLVADKALDYNSRMAQWDASQPKIGHMFAGSDFAFSWSFVEHNLTVEDHGYDWMLSNIAEDVYGGVRELIENSDAPSEVLQGDAADLSIDNGDVDAVVLDPPYYGMIMYAELGDYFYVWMKKYLNDIIPEFFNSTLTEKEDEAVANKSRFEGVESDELSKKELARREYERKMTDIFEEMYRVLNPGGIFTMMFTHKETEAWDTLTKALIESGFVVTASHPVNTENQHRVQQAGRNSADSTILLSSEKRDLQRSEPTLWEEVRKDTQVRAQEKVKQLESQEAEFTKVDMMLASFGPTLEIFTKNYPVVDDTGEEVSPQTALDEARGAVRDYLIEQYLNEGIRDVDAKTEWYVLAWFVFEAQRFPYDEGRRLAVGVGENVDSLKKENRMWRTKSGDIVLRPHGDRVQDVNKAPENRSGRKPVDPDSLSFSTALDKVHAAMHIYDAKGATEAWNWMNDRNCGSDPSFKATLEGLLRVLPHDHDDWKLARDLEAGETGEMLDLDLDSSIFNNDEDDGDRQGNLNDF